ncbi:hypothetical protein BDV28DRAFT_150587 [Aspergillus coremiiformis]|uniref:Invertebrate defensins family profile domain-containing protein n=1 Tax=Aspergillus coremiiformis TaxID=138285 RepID=A0A5N6Z261_9EURO|nr:hypothetical protein BDV28DRAFT_150587 [Aspergillus coremiiformis]
MRLPTLTLMFPVSLVALVAIPVKIKDENEPPSTGQDSLQISPREIVEVGQFPRCRTDSHCYPGACYHGICVAPD